VDQSTAVPIGRILHSKASLMVSCGIVFLLADLMASGGLDIVSTNARRCLGSDIILLARVVRTAKTDLEPVRVSYLPGAERYPIYSARLEVLRAIRGGDELARAELQYPQIKDLAQGVATLEGQRVYLFFLKTKVDGQHLLFPAFPELFALEVLPPGDLEAPKGKDVVAVICEVLSFSIGSVGDGFSEESAMKCASFLTQVVDRSRLKQVGEIKGGPHRLLRRAIVAGLVTRKGGEGYVSDAIESVEQGEAKDPALAKIHSMTILRAIRSTDDPLVIPKLRDSLYSPNENVGWRVSRLLANSGMGRLPIGSQNCFG